MSAIMKKSKQESFYLQRLFRGEMRSTDEHKHYQDEIKYNGSAIIISQGETEDRKYKFYTPELILLITTSKLEAINRETKSTVILDGWKFFDSYMEGYDKGVGYFESEYAISPDTLYGRHAEQYIYDIHLNYYHIQHTGLSEGWAFIKKAYPVIVSDKVFREHGYFSGIVSKVDEMISKHPSIFSIYNKCKFNESETETEEPINPTKQLITQNIEGIDQQGWKYAFRSDSDYETFVNLLTDFFELKEYSLPKTVIQLKRDCKTKLAKALREIHKELSEDKLSSDNKFFEIVETLNHFKNKSDLYKALTR
jgi:hypothetical protein